MKSTVVRIAGVLGAVLVLSGVLQVAQAANPDKGKLSPTSKSVTWSGGPLLGSAAALRRITCNPSTCDDFLLDVDLPKAAFPGKLPVMKLELASDPQNQMDIIICKPGACQDVNAADYEVVPAGEPGGSAVAQIQAPIKGTWKIRAGCTVCAGGSYRLTASVITVPIPGNNAPNFTAQMLPGLKPDAPEGAAEPGIRIGPKGEIVVDGPGGAADFWTSYDGGKTFKLHQPAEDAPGDTWATIGADGTIYADNLVITCGVCNKMYVSKDKGNTWHQPTLPANMDSDRQWITAHPTEPGVVFFTYHDIADPLIWVWKSTDHAETWTPIASISVQEMTKLGTFDSLGGNTTGPIAFAPDGTMYMTVTFNDFVEGITSPPTEQDFNISRIYVLRSGDGGVNWDFFLPVDHHGTGRVHHGFAHLTMDKKGNLYLVWSERPETDVTTDVYLTTSTDKAATWSAPKKVSSNGGSNIFATSGAKGLPGYIDVVWLEAAAKDFNDRKAEWRVVMAQSQNALAAGPTWTKTQVSPDVMHRGDVCQAGTLCLVTGGNRTLLDFIWMDIDAEGMAHVVYTDDLGGVRTVYAKQTKGVGTLGTGPKAAPAGKPKPAVLGKRATLPATGVGSGALGMVLLAIALVLRRRLRVAG